VPSAGCKGRGSETKRANVHAVYFCSLTHHHVRVRVTRGDTGGMEETARYRLLLSTRYLYLEPLSMIHHWRMTNRKTQRRHALTREKRSFLPHR